MNINNYCKHMFTKFTTLILTLSLVSGLSGCSFNAGLNAGTMPQTGVFVADNGMRFHIQPLSLSTLPVASEQAHSSLSLEDIHQITSQPKSVDYRLKFGDILSIDLVDYPDITAASNNRANNLYASGYTIDQQGYIQFPLIGRIKAQGLSVPQFSAALQQRLQRYLKFPDPQVKVLNYRGSKFYIDGEVQQPGEFNIADAPVTLYSAISMAGGETPEADTNSITLTRQGKTYQLGLEQLQKRGVPINRIYLQDGDSVHVNSQDRNKVYVLGEFGKVNPLEIPEQGLSLAHVLGESQGLNPKTADAAKIYVIRDQADHALTNIYYVDMQTMTNFALASRFEMQADDIVYVDPTGLTRWSRLISSILPSASVAALLSGL